MTVTLVVEDGTGLATANVYLSEADADTYWSGHGAPVTWTATLTGDKQDALVLGAQYLDLRYGSRWRGTRLKGRDQSIKQALDWPRVSVVDDSNFSVDSDAVPQAIKDATCEAALRHIIALADGGSLLPDLDSAGSIKSQLVKAGPITEDIEYVSGTSPLKKFSMIDAIVRELLEQSGGVSLG